VKRIGPTHFGLFDDVDWHLRAVQDGLEAAQGWLEREMPGDPPIERLRRDFTEWMAREGQLQGLSAEVLKAYDLANPTGMSADGLLRYWRKFRTPA
jgi:hypothetical protein